MIKIANFLLLLSLLTTLNSCNENPPEPVDDRNKVPYGNRTKITGKVLEYGSNKEIPNHMVQLQESFFPPFSGGGSYYSIDTTYTDSNGNFTFDFEHIKDDNQYLFSYRVQAISSNYYPNVNYLQSGYFEKNVKIFVDPNAWVKIHYINKYPFDDNDYFVCTLIENAPRIYGKDVDFIQYLKWRGGHQFSFAWQVNKNGFKTRYTDSLFLIPFDTINYEINY